MGSRQVIDSRLNPDGDSAGLVLSSVAVGYHRGKANEITVLDQVNAEVTGGQLVGLVGPNGAGKSTLLRTVAGLQPALSGTITINGHEVAKIPQRTIAKMLAAVLTDRQFGGRLRAHEVVALGRYPHMGMAASLTDHDRAIINDALEAVGAGHLANRDITKLSDGQRQRVLVARALAQSPSVMVLDEPTAFLDPPGRIELIELLREVSTQRKIAMVVCTHDVDIVLHYADQFWIAGPGTRVHIGEPGELVESGALEAAFATDGVVFDQQRSRFISARMAATTASP